jgi:hypothetical protein
MFEVQLSFQKKEVSLAVSEVKFNASQLAHQGKERGQRAAT